MTEPAQAIRLDIPRPAPEIVKGYQGLATTAISDIIDLSCVMRYVIQPLWPDIRVSRGRPSRCARRATTTSCCTRPSTARSRET